MEYILFRESSKTDDYDIILSNSKINELNNSLDQMEKIKKDYKRALNIKNHLSYKLGETLIEASKNWYKGGVKFRLKLSD